jgi:hypothetical protein
LALAAVIAAVLGLVLTPVLANSDTYAGNGGPILFHLSPSRALHLVDMAIVAGGAATSWAGAVWLDRRLRPRPPLPAPTTGARGTRR